MSNSARRPMIGIAVKSHGPRYVLLYLSLTTALALIALLSCQALFAQAASGTKDQATPIAQQSGTITGKVYSEDDRSMQYIPVYLSGQGKARARRYSALTNQNGEFMFRDVGPGIYLATTSYPGYVLADSVNATGADIKRYLPGDTISIQMIKGAAITGKVTGPDGQPLIDVHVSAIRTTDPDGHEIVSQEARIERITDDRGVYRLYGLKPGSYTVRAWGRPAGRLANLNPYMNDAYVYYPFGSRVSAREVQVSAGSESSGIDINYLSVPGHSLTGKVQNLKSTGNVVVNVYVSHVTKGNIEDSTLFQLSGGDHAFSFSGLQDGEYDVIAVYHPSDERLIISNTARATIKGRDAGGIVLTANPTGSIAGNIKFESGGESQGECQKRSLPLLEEILISAHGRQKQASRLESMFTSDIQTAVSDKGDFQLGNLPLSAYDIEVWLPSPDLYITRISITSAKAAGNRISSAKPQPAPLHDLIEVRDGTTIDGLSITIRSGAAGLSGSVSKTESHPPGQVTIYLVPLETESANDIWRYHQTSLDDSGKFAINNIMPGRYWIIALAESSSSDGSRGRLVWDATSRSKLRQQAQTAGKEIELKACQRMTDIEISAGTP